MATPAVLRRRDLVLLQSPIVDPPAGEMGRSSRGVSIEKKIEFLEILSGQEFPRVWLLVTPSGYYAKKVLLSNEKKREMFCSSDEVPPSAFSQTNVQEWDKFRIIDMDKEFYNLGSVTVTKTPPKVRSGRKSRG